MDVTSKEMQAKVDENNAELERLNTPKTESFQKESVQTQSLHERLANGAKVEVYYAEDSLIVTVDDEVLENAREAHLVATNHKSGVLVKLRCFERINNIDKWTDYLVTNPVVYMRSHSE